MGCSCKGSQAHSVSTLFTNKNPVTPGLRYLTSKLAALLPYGKVADFLGELLPLSAKATASTVRNRTMRVGGLLHKSASAIGTKPFGQLRMGSRRRRQRDHPTTLHALFY